MTTHDKDKIIAAAKEAGFSVIPVTGSIYLIDGYKEAICTLGVSKLYAIAFEDGRQAEREECAKVCEKLGSDYKGRFAEDDSLFLASAECADAIRARGDTK